MKLSTARTLVRNIVGRCHVGESNVEVIEYVQSRIKPSSWEEHEKVLKRAIIAEHKANMKVYLHVMGGIR